MNILSDYRPPVSVKILFVVYIWHINTLRLNDCFFTSTLILQNLNYSSKKIHLTTVL
jgi:hypothetical protein